MKRLSGGIDVGSESHHITILDDEDHILYNQKVSHQLSEFAESIKLFKQIEKQEGGKISFALEGKNGYSAPFDQILLNQGFTLYNVDNFKLKSAKKALYFLQGESPCWVRSSQPPIPSVASKLVTIR